MEGYCGSDEDGFELSLSHARICEPLANIRGEAFALLRSKSWLGDNFLINRLENTKVVPWLRQGDAKGLFQRFRCEIDFYIAPGQPLIELG